ncbi:helix-turn-helix transcriptional regulator [Streptomyces sp. DH18]|uniref:helix-turn-helix domain-containing protein n=1 Tax=Streptomyces sp. DH18 TaxID=3040126 RepID=UPI002442C0C1|nr:helix-turn-helix transcriptional regulator [Streptomyces sp. DH18]MDG9682383.1 helix-turn-helix transcriptional regulator [Streptomyces sp. DH18]
MGRRKNPVTTTNPYRRRIALMLRELLDASGLTFQQLADRCEGISRPTLQRAATGDFTPKEKTLKAFAAGCGFPEATDVLLRLRIRARIEDRGLLPELGTALHPSLISDWRDLSRAIEYLHESAGAPSFREVRDKSGNKHVLSISTLRRIIMRITTPVDEHQLLAIVHGCGITDQDALWTAAWAKVTTTTSNTAAEERPAVRISPRPAERMPHPDELGMVVHKRPNPPPRQARTETDRPGLLPRQAFVPRGGNNRALLARRFIDDMRQQHRAHDRPRYLDGLSYLYTPL